MKVIFRLAIAVVILLIQESFICIIEKRNKLFDDKKERIIQILITSLCLNICRIQPIYTYIAVAVLMACLYIQAYFDIKIHEVYKVITLIANIVLWALYIITSYEKMDVWGIATFAVINIIFTYLLRSYSAGDMKIMMAIIPVYSMIYTGDELYTRLLLMLLLANVFLIIMKVYDMVKYKVSFKEPKEFVPSILLGTMVMLII